MVEALAGQATCFAASSTPVWNPKLTKKKARHVSTAGSHNSGDVLLSHSASAAVPSALIGLTSEFGMGSGVTLPTLPPNP